MADQKITLTRGGYEHIQRQLARLEEQDISQRAMLANSESSGGDEADLGAEYDRRTRRAWTEEQIAHLRYILERAEIYEDTDPARVNTGERVTLWDFAGKEEIQFDVLSSVEITTQANIGPGVRNISAVSPIGQALIGKAVGDIVEVDVPDGKVRYAVRKIEPIPESSGE